MGAPVTSEGLKHHLDVGWRKKAIAGFVGPIAVSFATMGASQVETTEHDAYSCSPDNATYSNEAIRHELAQRCLHDLHGKIALVGIDISQQRLEDLRVRTSALMNRTTSGLFHPDIVAFPASTEASTRFHDLQTACIEPGDIQHRGPEMVDDVMHLSNFDHVITVTDLPACKSPEEQDFMLEGMAYPTHNWRYAAEFSLSQMQTEQSNKEAFVLDHEALHDEGLGHVGTFRSLRTLPGDSELNVFDVRKYKPLTANQNIDLDYLLGDGSFIENGAPYNVMGVGWYDQNDGVTINSLQRWRLQWPQRIEGDRMNWLKKLDDGTMHLANPTGVDHDFGVIDLSHNVDLTTNKSVKTSHVSVSCNQFVIEPIYDPKSHAKDIVEISFAQNVSGKSLEMVSLGYLDFSAPGLHNRVLTVNNQRITIDKTPDGYTVADTVVDK